VQLFAIDQSDLRDSKTSWLLIGWELFAINQSDLRDSDKILASDWLIGLFDLLPEACGDLVDCPSLGLWHHEGHVDDEEQLDHDEHHEHPGAHQ